MDNFNYCNPTEIIFGRDRAREVGSLAAKYGRRVLVIYGGGSVKRTGLYDQVMQSLKEAGLSVSELSGVQPNPRLSLVYQGIDICKDENIDFILAVGGGSVIDTAKAVAGGAVLEGDIWDVYIGKTALEKALPIGVILTIPASGSEASPDSVITKEEGMLKRGVTCEAYFPRFAIIDPALHFTLSPYQTACGCCDIAAHMMERYFTPSKHVDVTDRLIESGIRTVMHWAPVALADPENYEARAQISWIGTFCHNRLFDAGRIGDWASHNIEHELSAEYDIAHGAGLAIIFPAWMKYVYAADIDRFCQFAVRVMDVDYGCDEKERAAVEGIARLESFYKRLGLPVRLEEAGIGGDKFEIMSNRAMLYRDHIGELRKLYAQDIQQIYELANS